MRFSLDITCPPEEMQRRALRCQAGARYEYTDRVPVGFCLVPRYFAPVFKLRYADFFRDVETQFECQLEFAKYRIEHIPEDTCCQGPTLVVSPYFDNVVNASACGAEIVWSDDETPQACPVLKSVDDMERFQVPEPDAGLWGKIAAWWPQMKALAEQTRVTFNGQEGRVMVGTPGVGGEGPHMIAIDLAGQNFYWWMLECPEACHRLLDKITTGMIRAERRFRQLDPRPRGGYGLAEDSAQIMSPDLFRQFCVPYDNRLYETFGAGLTEGRGMHMCGRSAHLHAALIDDLHISGFHLFGYQVEPKVAAANLGGRTRLWGNINPMLMKDGTKEQVKEACMAALRELAPCGGFMLGDGANVCPGTPLENLAVFTEAAEEYGRPTLVKR